MEKKSEKEKRIEELMIICNQANACVSLQDSIEMANSLKDEIGKTTVMQAKKEFKKETIDGEQNS